MRKFLLAILLLPLVCCSTRDNRDETQGWDTPEASGGKVDSLVSTPADDRTSWQNPALVIEELGPVEGKTIADIGAGLGYFTFLLADAGARVIAIDIDPEYIEYIQARLEESTLADTIIQTRLSEANDPLLAPGEIDAALLVNTYTFLPERIEYLGKLGRALKPNGIICIVDYASGDVPVISEETPVLDPHLVEKELTMAGFQIRKLDTASLEYQYIITATPIP